MLPAIGSGPVKVEVQSWLIIAGGVFMIAVPIVVGLLAPFSFFLICVSPTSPCASYSYYELFRFTIDLSIAAGIIALVAGLILIARPGWHLASGSLSAISTVVYAYGTVSQQIDARVLSPASYSIVQFLPAVLSMAGSPVLAGGLLTLFPGKTMGSSRTIKTGA